MSTLPTAAGTQQWVGYGTPEIWSPKLLVKFYEACVMAQIGNTDYEGEIKTVGSKVIIRTTPDISVSPYTKNEKLSYESLVPGKIEMDIDQASKWGFIVDRVDDFQTDLNYMEAWTTDASEKQKKYVDTVCFAHVFDNIAAANKGAAAGAQTGGFNLGTTGSPIAMTSAKALEAVLMAAAVLDEQNRPDTDRYLVVPPWVALKLKLALKDASITGDGKSTIRSGLVGGIDRFKVYSSNLLPRVADGSDTCFKILAGHKSGLSFASQMLESSVLKEVESTFGAICRGLQVFGRKVLQPESLVQIYAKYTAET